VEENYANAVRYDCVDIDVVYCLYYMKLSIQWIRDLIVALKREIEGIEETLSDGGEVE